MRMLRRRFIFQWNLFPMIQLTISQDSPLWPLRRCFDYGSGGYGGVSIFLIFISFKIFSSCKDYRCAKHKFRCFGDCNNYSCVFSLNSLDEHRTQCSVVRVFTDLFQTRWGHVVSHAQELIRWGCCIVLKSVNNGPLMTLSFVMILIGCLFSPAARSVILRLILFSWY